MKIVLKAKGNGKEILFEVGKIHVSVGRGDNAHIKLNDEDCSRTHCKFYVESNKFWVEDMSSKNGTYVNGVRIQQSQLYLHDRIKAGETEITIPIEHNNTTITKLLTFSGSAEERVRKTLDVESVDVHTQARLNPITAIRNYSQPTQFRSQRRKNVSEKEDAAPEKQAPPPAWLKGLAEGFDLILTIGFVALPGVLYSLNKNQLPIQGIEGISSVKRMAIVAGVSLLTGFLFWVFNTKNSGGSMGERLLEICWNPKNKK